MDTMIDRIRLYLRVKWLFLGGLFIYVYFRFFQSFFSSRSDFVYLLYGLLFLGVLSALLLEISLFRKQGLIAFTHFSLVYDLLSFIAVIYSIGGSESRWFFMPALVIFSAAAIFGLRASLAYAAVALLAMAVLFLGEYAGLRSFQPLFELYKGRIGARAYYFDYFVGLALFYAAMALGTGRFQGMISETSSLLEKSREETRAVQAGAQNTQKALMNVAEDLEKSKMELERRVFERTGELEDAKASLEQRVSERTQDLDKSRKAIMHMLKDLKEDMVKLQAIDRMKTEFLSMVSHELRTPITPIKGYLVLLLAGKMGRLSTQQKQALETVSRQNQHLEGLIDSLLDLSRLELGKSIPIAKTELSMTEIILGVVEATKLSAEEHGLSIEFDLERDLPPVMGDEIKLKRVLTNLVGNAIKFTPEGGKITVRASIADAALRVEVIDNGVGIAREYKEKIFEKFSQVDSSSTRSAEGMGLGLAIARELIGLHDGEIWVESAGLGKGSRFIFTLPCANKALSAARKPEIRGE